MKRITSIQMLKEEAASKNNGGYTDFFISLNSGARSSKGIIYYPDTNRFDVYNDIDGSFEDDLTEEQLIKQTHIGDAIDLGAFFKYE
ncbi:MAG: hypothetical protein SFU21_05000 [Flavihumibacter sp.]|nr:hypothetical protein [Flavihumibacter sp.]